MQLTRQRKRMNEIKYFSMFTGVGGFELGLADSFEEAQIKRGKESWTNSPHTNRELSAQGRSKPTFGCIGFSEIDKHASELLKNKWPEIKNYGDATTINPKWLPDFELLVGGFPCQAFSIAGKRKGFEDTRGTLFHDIVRILKVKRPKRLLLENVKGLLNHDSGRTFAVILASLSELGYVIQWMVLNSKFFGVPQNRERVFIIGSLGNTAMPEILPLGEGDGRFNEGDGTTAQAQVTPTIDGRVGAGTHRSPYIQQLNNPTPSNNRLYGEKGISPALNTAQGGNRQPKIVASRGRNPMNPNDRTTGSPTEQRFEVNESGTTNTLSSVQKDNMVMERMRIRRLTPLECERLQGFPDGWTEGFSDTQRYKMMGNAVTVNVIKAIAERLKLTDGGAG